MSMYIYVLIIRWFTRRDSDSFVAWSKCWRLMSSWHCGAVSSILMRSIRWSIQWRRSRLWRFQCWQTSQHSGVCVTVFSRGADATATASMFHRSNFRRPRHISWCNVPDGNAMGSGYSVLTICFFVFTGKTTFPAKRSLYSFTFVVFISIFERTFWLRASTCWPYHLTDSLLLLCKSNSANHGVHCGSCTMRPI